MPDMTEAAFLSAVQAGASVPGSSRVLVAYSGGTDSSVLLSLFVKHAALLSITVSACHVDHMLRGEESVRDAEFCRARCAELGVPFVLKRANVSVIAREKGLSVEEAAREARYALLKEAASELGCDRIALAHHRDDRVETFLFRLFRGSGLKGLLSIPWSRGEFVRPLLGVSRACIEDWARLHGVPSVEDSSNRDNAFSRNWLRNELIPMIESRFPGASERMASLIPLLQAEDELARQAMDAYRDKLQLRSDGSAVLPAGIMNDGTPPAAAARLVREASEAAGCNDFPGAPLLSALRRAGESTDGNAGVYASETLAVVREYGFFVFRKAGQKFPFSTEYVILKDDASCRLAGRVYTLRRGCEGLSSLSAACSFDGSNIPALEIRPWQPGDRIGIAPSGSRKLQDIFTDAKLSQASRARAAVFALEASSDVVLFYAEGIGFRVSTGYYVRPGNEADAWTVTEEEADADA